MKRTGMMKIKDILRYRHDFGLPRSQIAAATGVSTGTVSHVLARAEAAGLSCPSAISAARSTPASANARSSSSSTRAASGSPSTA